ncbi:hypothetical protein [Mycoplasmopsis cynos]|nr:hypothetical protein [Mycoplasmopsis cynos]WAM04962.1 hypothetical protein ONA01_02130 [Mycoplasmopsis cynos]
MLSVSDFTSVANATHSPWTPSTGEWCNPILKIPFASNLFSFLPLGIIIL